MMTTTPTSTRSQYARLFTYIRPYWKALALAVIGMAGSAATEPVFPAIMKYLLDHGFQTPDARLIWAIPTGIITLFLVRGVFSFCTGYLMMWISTHLVTTLRREMFAKILTLPTQIFHEQSAGKLISRVIYDVGNVNEGVTVALVTVVRESLTVLTLTTYLIYLDWKLTLITFTIAPIIALIIKLFSQRMRNASRNTLDAVRQMSHTIEESVEANKVIKIFGGQSQQIERFDRDTQRFRRSVMRESIPNSAITPVTHMAASLAVAMIIYLALSQTTGKAGDSAGGFISFITAMLMIISPIKQLTNVSAMLQRALTASESIFGLLDMPIEEDKGSMTLTQVREGIVFDRVSFRYPGSDITVLDAISLHIKAGQTVALVGGSGGGKTTIGALVARFYRASSGTIRIDGIDINQLTLESLRHNLALVSQDIVLFNDTIAANIAFGTHKHCQPEDIIAAAKAAHAWDFISQLPEGLNTMIGEDGAKLSGGQRQRIAIARALLKNAPILILDEATSALDTESERQVQAALSTLMKNRTTLVIAHRLSTIEHADLILVMDKGRIVESGTHHSLLAHGGYYANLNQMQS